MQEVPLEKILTSPLAEMEKKGDFFFNISPNPLYEKIETF